MTDFPTDNAGIARSGQNRDAMEGTLTDERLGHLVRLLGDHPTVVMSGTKIADELGVSRSEVWRLIEHLRELGVQIEGHPATGYQLGAIPDLLLPEALEPQIKGTLFAHNVHHYFRIGSTNVAAMQAGAAGAPEGTVFVAEEQTAGKGRGGHSWHSVESAGIYCSVLLRPRVAPADALILALAAGVATADAIASVTGLAPDLRWPNDLLFGLKKFCGILTELNAEATRVRYVVIGVGINVNHQEFPEEISKVATSLRLESGRVWSRVEVAAALLKSLDRVYAELLRGGAEARRGMIARFQEMSSLAKDRRVFVEEDGGYAGTSAGLDERGFLQVSTNHGKSVRTVLSGGVRSIEDVEGIRQLHH
ncbi:Biotin--acetyl-CoA-carboxylase ligase [Candidatus Koribacter versatilis Ellin345]|uniref:Bifunctional ligase/repressor BirA n=1 Tax=Koribacter versatilis (strain Ellin345) TaxID=204669 RepID=Q1IVG0_KORVE|nr:biotin--[acetyl-CoA-carboxylase] ligase [Candidatus Koribacter versatilis]ABF39140.1 Biotin--acetyl-CoA-carboxylase ligase [Candidatus Koribacter versatilis Ellin345]